MHTHQTFARARDKERGDRAATRRRDRGADEREGERHSAPQLTPHAPGLQSWEDEVHIYIVEELCEGMDALATLKASGGKYEEGRAAELFVQMLRAVHYCHNHGVCHRDLKLENFIFRDKSPDSRLLLIDFGMGQRFGDTNGIRRMTERIGSVHYMAPEVLCGRAQRWWGCGPGAGGAAGGGGWRGTWAGVAPPRTGTCTRSR